MCIYILRYTEILGKYIVYVCVSIYLSIYLCCIFSFKHVWLNRIDMFCLPILSLICSNICMSYLTLKWNEFKKVQNVSLVLLTQTGAIFAATNNEMTNTMSCYIHWHQEEEEEQVWVEFMEEKNFIWSKRKYLWEMY